MTEAALALAERVPARAPLRERLFRRLPQISFTDLVWAHAVRTQALLADGRPDDEKEERYRRYLATFQARYGDIVDVYWCVHDVSAVALTRKGLRLRRDRLRIHRASDWVTRDVPEVASLLHRCDTLAVKSNEVLRETNQRVALQWLYALMAHLLGTVDSAAGKLDGQRLEAARHDFEAEWKRIGAYYRSVGVRAGQIVYFWGMVAGLAMLAAIGLALLPLLSAAGAADHSLRLFYGCLAAGALGAFVSVVQRVTQDNFRVDYEAGRKAIMRIGSFRPYMGGIFGTLVYFGLSSGLLHVAAPGEAEKEFGFYVVLAFAAGFSERFAKDVLEQVTNGGPPPPPVPVPEATEEAGQ